ncbi:MAG: ATP-binding protein [Phycisphaerae bacterium]|jgi:serine/threonine-protein kinase RsbW
MSKVDPDNEATFHTCVIESDPCATDEAKNAVMQELQRCGYTDDAIFAIKLALEEALMNAVKHGNGCDPSKRVTVRYAVTPQKAVLVVCDEGPGFIPDHVPDPTSPDRLPLPSGRGIMLMRAYMDQVVYRDHGREVYLLKRRT